MLLDLAFVFAVSPLFSYAGFVLEPSAGKMFSSYCLTIVFSALLPAQITRVSDFLLLLIFVFLLLPCMSLWALQDLASYHIALLSGGYALAIAATLLRVPEIPIFTHGRALFYLVSLGLAVAVFGVLWQRGAASYLNFDLLAVYDVRDDISQNILYGVPAYLVPWYGKAVAPALLGVMLYRRLWFFALVIIFSEALLFGLTSNKEYLFYPVLVCGIFALSSNVRELGVKFVAVSSATLASTIAAFLLTDFSLLTSIVAHRSFFVVALNHFEYFDFFSEAPFVFMSNSILSGLSEYPFDAPVPELIGYGRYGLGVEGFSNTGVLAAGYMHFGGVGVLFFGFYAGVVFRIMDALVADRIPLRLGVLVTAIPALQFVNTDLGTSLLTGGILVSIVLLLLLASQGASYGGATVYLRRAR